MEGLTVAETLHELYISLTALLFDIALCIVVLMQGGRGKDGGSRFFSVALAVTLSCALSCVSYFTGHATDIHCPVALSLFLNLAAYMGNIFVTFFLTRYIGGFFREDALPKAVWRFNDILLFASGVILIVYYVMQIPRMISNPSADVFAHGFFRFLVGYAIELYYMIICLSFVRRGRELDLRAKATIVAAFLISVITFIMQVVLGSKPLVNYLGVSVALLVFYFAAETPDYHKLQRALAEVEEEKERAVHARKLADEANRSKAELIAKLSQGMADTEMTPAKESAVRIVPEGAAQAPETDADAASMLRAFYKQTDALNYDEAKRLLATDELIGKTAKQFYEEIEENSRRIEQLLADGDFENYTIRVHGLKSGARLIGAIDLSEHAKRLEEAGNRVRAS